MYPILFLLAATPALSAPGEAPPAEQPPAVPSEDAPEAELPFAELLAEARALYVSGEHQRALELFTELRSRALLDERVEPAQAVRALAYLGEIYYILGEYDAARVSFLEMLEIDSDYALSPLEHPPAILGAVQQIRTQLEEAEADTAAKAPPEPVVEPISRLPWWGYTPLGIPQMAQRRPVRGLLYATLQTGFAISSVALLSHLQFLNGTALQPYPWPAEDYAPGYRQVQQERFLAQWPTTAAFYLTWLVSHLDARQQWRREYNPLARVVSVGPTGLGIMGRF